jgi:hypothetical protein
MGEASMAWEIVSRQFEFDGGRGERTASDIGIVVNFGSRRVTRAFCAIGSFDLAFLNDDHHVQQIGIALQEPEILSARGEFGVRIRGQVILRDKGTFDDRYRGQVRLIVFADLADA